VVRREAWSAELPGERVREDDHHLRAGRRLSVISLVWTVVTSAAAIDIGVSRSSLVLIAFGATGVLDALGSAALVLHFRHALLNDVSERLERIALQVITIGLIVVGAVTAAASVLRLAGVAHTETAPEGIVLAAGSAVVLAGLGARKRRVGASIPSGALVADGWVSTIGALLALVTVAGTAVNAALSWAWTDPAAALVVGVGAIGMSVELRHQA
jgi:divalent metal cation (Fe/Co/Zn/Cd) transporter